MGSIRERAIAIFPSVMLTVLSMIQALALGSVVLALAVVAYQGENIRRFWENSLADEPKGDGDARE